ncbi:MAG: RNA ligase (ATP) [Bacteroidota bacterium]
MRKLASIQKIRSLEPIEGADAIEKATVLGWQLVVKKGEFKPGDLAVYCEIDSLMPERPEFEFLKPRKMRIRTVRLRGQVSQGICFPLSILPDDFPAEEGADCTEVLGITKYEAPIPANLSGIAKGKFPGFIPKTDETRVQNMQKALDKYKGTPCYITEKLDGSSATFYLNKGDFGVCSRNLDLLEDEKNTFWKMARQLEIEKKLLSTGGNIALQGELIGESIQSNKLKIRGQDVRFFSAWDIDKRRFFNFEELKDLLLQLDLEMVPVVNDHYILDNDIDAIVQMSVIKSAINPKTWAEGIVIRPLQEISDVFLLNENLTDGRLSFKAVNPEFLIKYGE